jgi:large subunit ribosomal protein L7/L12
MGATFEQTAERAYQRFVDRGRAHGHDVEDWVAAERDLATYDLVLLTPGAGIIEVLRELRDVTGIGLRELKDLIEAGPLTILQARPLAEAEALGERMRAWGARVVVRADTQ